MTGYKIRKYSSYCPFSPRADRNGILHQWKVEDAYGREIGIADSKVEAEIIASAHKKSREEATA